MITYIIKKFNITINKFFSVNKIGYILKQCNFYKDKGISCIKVLKSPEVMLTLLKKANEFGIPASYVLFDSWFTYPKTLIEIAKLKFNTIAMVKAMPRVYYNYDGKNLNLKSLYATLKKKKEKRQS